MQPNCRCQGASFAAQQLFNKHRRVIVDTSPNRMQKQRMEELRDLQGVTSIQDIITNRTAQAAKAIRYPVSVSVVEIRHIIDMR